MKRAAIRGTVGRTVTILAATVGVMTTAGLAIAADNPDPGVPAAAPSASAVAPTKPAAAPTTAAAVTSKPAAAPTKAAVAPSKPAADKAKKSGFFETYRGRHIMGWGRDEAACAYIDGMRLVVYPADGGMYTSAVQSFQPQRGLRAITKASVRALGDLGLSATTEEPTSHCPEFKVTPKTGK
ncbi:tyrosinase family oxidase copper chaperone [Actinoplanes sp. NEAU-A12]|uniref:Tyrosinase family oxidase copper chaperone n=1 Tax=Actinoplanes sandaracinus TaxID=3045177 RepID=A0ABT6WGX3_9ACTN|nr:tyrosinase family oxidase copper chaperone [Actinoplanes sandaracinus]MDI6098969.1 tyrosinase family oxidase copper chaperone [Actinoplanes sandaracinus]